MKRSYRQQLEAITELELLEYADIYTSASDFIRKYIGTSSKGQYSSIVNKKMKDWDIRWKRNLIHPIAKKKCPVCEEEFETQIGHSDEKTTCGYACSNTYFRSGKDNGQYVDGNSSYRITAFTEYDKICNRCGIDDYDVLVVHHKDKDRTNNHSSNLEVLCANCHMKEHKQ